VGAFYVVASRSHIEQTIPLGDQTDIWTENALWWQASPNVNFRNNTADYINSTQYYGSTSVEFSVSNASTIWMEISSLNESVSCGAEGFKNVSLRVKRVAPDAKPENVSLFLYSLSGSNFYSDITETFSGSATNVWNNITLSVGSGGWISSGVDATWKNITGLRMEFVWSSNTSVNLLVDGLFFRGIFKNPLELYGVSYLASSVLNGFVPFLFEWLVLTGIMYVVIKALKGNVVWKPLMVAVGFSLITIVIQSLVLAIVYTDLPILYYPLEVLAGAPGEFEVAYQVIVDKIAFVTLVGGIIQLFVYVWTAALGTFVTRAITEFSWIKSLMVSVASLFATILILGLILGI
jgi:hypothetical protein